MDQPRRYRIYRRSCRQRGKGGQTYKWIRLYVPIPACFHDVVEPFLSKDLKVDVKQEGDSLLISATLTSMGG